MYRLLAFDRPLIRLPEQVVNLDGGQVVEVVVGEHGLDRGIFHGDSTPDAALFSARNHMESMLGATRARVQGTSIHCNVDYVQISDVSYKMARNYWSNGILWNTFHDLPFDNASEIKTHDEFEKSYDLMNRRFAKRAAARKVAEKHRASCAQISLRWAVDLGVVVIPKSAHSLRQRENLELHHIALDDEDRELLSTLDLGESVAWDSRVHEEW